jgi:hypothetical protein
MIALISVFISLVCVNSVAANNSREWIAGDLISVGLVCKDEESILRIVNADVKSEELVVVTMNQSLMMGVCISFEGSMRFLVQKALVHYKDHAGRSSVVLGVGNSDQDFLGWVLALGKFVSEKKSEETSI